MYKCITYASEDGWMVMQLNVLGLSRSYVAASEAL